MRAQMRLLFAIILYSDVCVCLHLGHVCVFVSVHVCSPRSTPRHAVRVRWQFPCLAVTEECILLQSELAAGCFDAALCYGSGIITLPVIKTKLCDSGPLMLHG